MALFEPITGGAHLPVQYGKIEYFIRPVTQGGV